MENADGTPDQTETNLHQTVQRLRETLNACSQVEAEALLLRRVVDLEEIASRVHDQTKDPIIRIVAELTRDTARSVAEILLAQYKPAPPPRPARY